MASRETDLAVRETRRACRQFALEYFAFCKTLVESIGEDEALPIVQKALFNLSLERTDKMREEADKRGLKRDLETFTELNDLPVIAWDEWTDTMGGVKCPYAEAWLEYFDEYPWFSAFASLYCDVIDTTNIENYTGTLSHKITKNLLWGDDICDHEYFPSEDVKSGNLTYGERD